MPVVIVCVLAVQGDYTPSPLIYDSAPDAAQPFAAAYGQVYGTATGWREAMEYEAAQVVEAALHSATIGFAPRGTQDTASSVAADRLAIRDALAAVNSPQTGLYTINGLVYVDADHDSIVPIRFGQYQAGHHPSMQG